MKCRVVCFHSFKWFALEGGEIRTSLGVGPALKASNLQRLFARSNSIELMCVASNRLGSASKTATVRFTGASSASAENSLFHVFENPLFKGVE